VKEPDKEYKEMNKINFELEQFKSVNEALRESEERYRTLIEQSPDSITIHDLEGKILFINPSAIEMFAATGAEEMIGRNSLEFVDPDYHDLVKDAIMEAMERYKKNVFVKNNP